MAHFNFENLVSKISDYGVARPNRFEAEILFPAAVQSAFAGSSEAVSVKVKSLTMPGRNISTFEHGDVNQTNKFPYTFIDDDITFTFLLTNDYYMRQMFDNWMSGIFDTQSYRVGYKKDYSVDVIIQQLNQKDIPVYGVKLEKAFPITMNSIELNQDSQTVLQMSVTFAFDKYVPEGPLSSTASAIQSAIPGGLI